jgi:tRNA(fMet)-specific endonuclease VapC
VSFLLDTDTCSAYVRGKASVSGRVIQHGGQLNISVVSIGELYAWALRTSSPPSRRRSVEQFLANAQVRDLDIAIAEHWGEIRAAQLDRGTPSPTFDLLIAATALEHSLILVTHNTKDFVHIPGLQVVDWLAL